MSRKKIEFYKTIIDTLTSCLDVSINKLISDKTVEDLNGYCGALSEEKIKTTMMIASSAKYSVFSVLKMADWEGFFVKDIYPIARSIVESLVNSTYIMLEEEEVARKAYKYVGYAEFKFSNREVGSGKYKLNISSVLEADEERIRQYFSEFKKNSWTQLDLPSRIRVVGDFGFNSAALDFLGAYSLVYSVSSEIIHGSPFGMNYFIKDSKNKHGESSFEEFISNTEKKVEFVLLSIILAISGYLKVNSVITKKEGVSETIEKLTDGILEDSISFNSKS